MLSVIWLIIYKDILTLGIAKVLGSTDINLNRKHLIRLLTYVQSQHAVTAYFLSKQLLHVDFAEEYNACLRRIRLIERPLLSGLFIRNLLNNVR